MNLLHKKIARIKKVIDSHHSDGDSEYHLIDELIPKILDTFTKVEWNYLRQELPKLEEYQLSVFADVILTYTQSHEGIVDEYELFFFMFVNMNDIENLEYFLFHVMYVVHIKHPKLELLERINQKIEFLSTNTNDQGIKDFCVERKTHIDRVIEKFYR